MAFWQRTLLSLLMGLGLILALVVSGWEVTLSCVILIFLLSTGIIIVLDRLSAEPEPEP